MDRHRGTTSVKFQSDGVAVSSVNGGEIELSGMEN